MGPIQVLPPGLINMLQLKVGGYAPDMLAQTVQPTIDLEQWWLRATKVDAVEPYSRVLAGPAQIGAVRGLFDTATATIALGPSAREWWFVHNVVMNALVTTAGSVNNIAIGYTKIGGPWGGTDVLLGPVVPTLTSLLYTPLWANGFWMPPGSVLGVYIDSVIGAASSVTIDLRGLSYTVCPL